MRSPFRYFNASPEVAAERIRDKIGQPKRKGLWMGDKVSLGYDARNRCALARHDR